MLPSSGTWTTCQITRPFGTDPDPGDRKCPCKFNKFCWKEPEPQGKTQSYAYLRNHQGNMIDWDA